MVASQGDSQHRAGDSGDLVEGLLYNPLFIAQGEIMRGLLNPVREPSVSLSWPYRIDCVLSWAYAALSLLQDIILIGEPAGRSAAGDALVALWQTVCACNHRSTPFAAPHAPESWN